MISLHSGRLLLVCEKTHHNWQAHVVLGPKPEHQIISDTGTVHLQTALLRGQMLFQAAVAKWQPNKGQRCCWDCVQWELPNKGCGLGFPEAKHSNGRYAKTCELYSGAFRR